MDVLGYSIDLLIPLNVIKDYVASIKGVYCFQNKFTDTGKVVAREPPAVTFASSASKEVTKNLQDGGQWNMNQCDTLTIFWLHLMGVQ